MSSPSGLGQGLPGGALEDCNRLPHAQAESCHRHLAPLLDYWMRSVPPSLSTPYLEAFDGCLEAAHRVTLGAILQGKKNLKTRHLSLPS